jgi:hypothetical protein
MFMYLYRSLEYMYGTAINLPYRPLSQDQHQIYLAVLLSNKQLIIFISSGMRNGLDIASSMPACLACSICSLLAFALTAMMGTWPINSPSSCNARICRAHVLPSMMGISTSMRTTDSLCGSGIVGVLQYAVLRSSTSASRPWLATCTVQPIFLS